MRAWGVWIAAFAFWSSLGPAARADRPDQARAHYERGLAAYGQRDFARAAVEYEAAFDLKPDPALLYNAAQAHRLAGNRRRAVELYQSYLQVFSVPVENRAEVERLVAGLKAAIEDEERRAAVTPATAERAREIFLPRANSDTRPDLSLAPPPPRRAAVTPVAAPPARRPIFKRPWFWAAVGGAAAVLATGIALGIVYGGERDPPANFGVVRGN